MLNFLKISWYFFKKSFNMTLRVLKWILIIIGFPVVLFWYLNKKNKQKEVNF